MFVDLTIVMASKYGSRYESGSLIDSYLRSNGRLEDISEGKYRRLS